MIQQNDKPPVLFTLELTPSELELLFDKLNGIKLSSSIERKSENLLRSINDKVFKATL